MTENLILSCIIGLLDDTQMIYNQRDHLCVRRLLSSVCKKTLITCVLEVSDHLGVTSL